MTIIAIDTETQGLNTNNWIMGCICHQDMKTETFNKKKDMWNRILELGEEHMLKNETLLVYAHNMAYDFRVIRPEHLPRNMTQFAENPFIIDARDGKGRIYMKFLSTTSLYRGPLSGMGEMLGYPKSPTPEWLKKDEHEPGFIELTQARAYMEQDTKIVMKYLIELKKLLKDNGLRPRWIITAGQNGMNGMLSHLMRTTTRSHWFEEPYKRKLWRTKHPEKIHEAIRGGRVQAFRFGKIQNASKIDINSHYPHQLMTMRCPDLRTEEYIEKPDTYRILHKLGVAKARVEVGTTPYGVLPIRQNDQNTVWPNTPGQILVGTWTLPELEAAHERGWTIHELYWAITYDDITNPFTKYIHRLGLRKQETDNEMERHFLKMLMNGGIGKFAQQRTSYDYEWRSVEEDHIMREHGYDAIDTWETERLYRKETGKNYPGFYAPILNALVTANARIRLLEDMERVKPEDLYYTDTDALILSETARKTIKFKYGNSLGEYKLEDRAQPLLVYGKKAYMIGEDIKLSGVGKAWVNPHDMHDGHIVYKRMLTEHQTPNTALVGTFQTLRRDLHQQTEDSKTLLKEVQQTPVHIDHRCGLSGDDLQWMHSNPSTPEEHSSSESS